MPHSLHRVCTGQSENTAQQRQPQLRRGTFIPDPGPLRPLRVHNLHLGGLSHGHREPASLQFRACMVDSCGQTARLHYHSPGSASGIGPSLIPLSPVHWNHTTVHNELSGAKYSAGTHQPGRG